MPPKDHRHLSNKWLIAFCASLGATAFAVVTIACYWETAVNHHDWMWIPMILALICAVAAAAAGIYFSENLEHPPPLEPKNQDSQLHEERRSD